MRVGFGALLVLGACGSTTTPEGAENYDAVARVLNDRCISCHQDGGAAPVSFEDPETVAVLGQTILDAIEDGTMPPFDAREGDECQPELPWKNDPRLTDAEINTIRSWIDAGTPTETTLNLEKPEPPVMTAPDAEVALVEAEAVEGTKDIYKCFRLEIPVEEDIYITGMEFKPDNDLVVHHALIWLDPEDQSADKAGEDGSYNCSGTPGVYPTTLVGAWAPGAGVQNLPEGTGIPVSKGATLVANIHYHPTGNTTELDQSSVALKWTTEKPQNYVYWYLVDIPFGADNPSAPFEIPANAERHKEVVEFTMPTAQQLGIGALADLLFPLRVYSISPHMHYLGAEMKVEHIAAETGEETCMVHTPRFRFDWQTQYEYDGDLDELPGINPGDTLRIKCFYNNSPSNPFFDDHLAGAGRDEAGSVYWGEETADEMCMAMVGLITPPLELF